ncbi:R-LORF2 [Gallid alphaherpesvirus 2]|uniref:R-LORF2 n=1 Tax=Gallid alphaherpesvirus 2 TaxID=10390 RepID=I6SSR2_9ALPH|nr:R-LORF2 [Gallid alphaherpesvirus 2]AFM75590.1 R-LORF2 [Gallid alphaherpesvirus 2]
MQALLLVLVLFIVQIYSLPGNGISLESLAVDKRCKCVKVTNRPTGLGPIIAVDVIPPGIHCRRTEIIFALKKNRKVCVDPEAPWVQQFIKKLERRHRTRKENLMVGEDGGKSTVGPVKNTIEPTPPTIGSHICL